MNSNHPLGMELGNRRYEASPWFENPNSARPQGGADSLIEDYEEGLEQCNSQRSKAGFLRDDYSELLDRTDRILRGDEMNIDEIDDLSDSISDLKNSFNDD